MYWLDMLRPKAPPERRGGRRRAGSVGRNSSLTTCVTALAVLPYLDGMKVIGFLVDIEGKIVKPWSEMTKL